jgi:hypothetical protein
MMSSHPTLFALLIGETDSQISAEVALPEWWEVVGSHHGIHQISPLFCGAKGSSMNHPN